MLAHYDQNVSQKALLSEGQKRCQNSAWKSNRPKYASSAMKRQNLKQRAVRFLVAGHKELIKAARIRHRIIAPEDEHEYERLLISGTAAISDGLYSLRKALGYPSWWPKKGNENMDSRVEHRRAI